MKYLLSALAATAMAGTAFAEPLKLTPADPQPSDLSPGLAVSYAYGSVSYTHLTLPTIYSV